MLTDVLDKLQEIVEKDSRYRDAAYFFVLDALERLMRNSPQFRHVSGKELLKSIQQEAVDQFGPMALTVFKYWGIENSLDFGRIVFNMVEQGLLLKQEADVLSDFEDAQFLAGLKKKASRYELTEIKESS